jgi:hypothetical protein
MTTGASSSFPITRLAAKYNQMQKDGRVLSNRQAIDVVDTRIIQLLERIDVDDAPDRMEKLLSLWAEFTEAHDSGRSVEENQTRDRLAKEFEKAYHDYEGWRQMFEALDLRRKMVESEVKVLMQIKAIITAEDAYELSAKMLAAVMNVLDDDPKKMKQVQYEFARIIGESSDLVTARYDEDAGGRGGENGSEE